jgi:hypothetical protein
VFFGLFLQHLHDLKDPGDNLLVVDLGILPMLPTSNPSKTHSVVSILAISNDYVLLHGSFYSDEHSYLVDILYPIVTFNMAHYKFGQRNADDACHMLCTSCICGGHIPP